MSLSFDRGLLGRLARRKGLVAVAGVLGAVGVGSANRSTVTSVVATASAPAALAEAASEGSSAAAWDLPNLDHNRVDYWVERFTTDEDMREKFEGFLRRSGWYREMISGKLAERGLPQDLLYLSMIESGFQPHAHSRASAVGLWQFIPETGRRYGLRIDGGIDERGNPELATDAALDYLGELHDRFGSWYLAAAAYNTGENRVARLMKERLGRERARSEEDYYRIWNDLPQETRDYVPLMVAAGRISKDPARYGFDDVQPEPPLEYEEVMTDAGLSLEQVARAAGADVQTVRLLNTQLRNGRLPQDRRVALRLPPGTAEEYQANWKAYVKEGRPAPAARTAGAANRTYKVRRGDSLGSIARRHGMTVSALKRANGLRSDRIYAGQQLRIAR